jgi:hypothetical protein
VCVCVCVCARARAHFVCVCHCRGRGASLVGAQITSSDPFLIYDVHVHVHVLYCNASGQHSVFGLVLMRSVIA